MRAAQAGAVDRSRRKAEHQPAFAEAPADKERLSICGAKRFRQIRLSVF